LLFSYIKLSVIDTLCFAQIKRNNNGQNTKID
jgi:hypothetical protein